MHSTILLDIWHDFRLTILLCLVFVAVPLRILQAWRKRRLTKLALEKQLPLIYEQRQQPSSGLISGVLEKQPIIPSRSKDQGNARSSETRVQSKPSPKRVLGAKKPSRGASLLSRPEGLQVLIFYFSLTGNTEVIAQKLAEDINAYQRQTGDSRFLPSRVLDLAQIDFDDYFISAPVATDRKVNYVYLMLLPSYDIDTMMSNLMEHLKETHHDFRLDTGSLSGILGYSVFGFGDKEGWPSEEEGFCSQALEIDKWLAKLTGRKRAYPIGLGDVKSDAQDRLKEWRTGLQEVMSDILAGNGLGEGVPGSGNAAESDVESVDDVEGIENGGKDAPDRTKSKRKPLISSRMDDLEDLGRMIRPEDVGNPSSTSVDDLVTDFTTKTVHKPTQIQPPKPMVPESSPTYAALTKQGYTIVGSHSGVKICRWTKSALRGRGSCYKFSFYGIKSHQCMETTPSLSCSNKCVFCWRHGTNPVGTTWRWQVDPPEAIFDGVTAAHYKKIKMLKGVPGVRAERFAEAMRIRHCALSLVGEPIFYPHINALVGLLHSRRISTFLVCNAQHPDQLAALAPVTQLYVSIDASNRDSLRRIDRPLHRDFWERFCRCLDILREKRHRQRTVFRLTLVKGFNVEDEVEGYADLVARGLPCFVEVKGVTYCGTSASSTAGLTMRNVPFYAEVCEFVVALDRALRKRGLEYGIAAEHEHSCCTLLASRRFYREGRWHTLIGYERFFECLESGREFSPEDYMGPPTPEWALWGNGGFDPADERVRTKGKNRSAVVRPVSAALAAEDTSLSLVA